MENNSKKKDKTFSQKRINNRINYLFYETQAIQRRTRTKKKESSSEEEHKVNALASGAEEGRDKLRKATGRSKYLTIRRYPNEGTQHVEMRVIVY